MKNIKKFRTLKNIDQKDLAKLLGVSRTSLSYFENGVVQPREKTFKKMCDIFECTEIELYGTEVFRTKPKTEKDILDILKALSYLSPNAELQEAIKNLYLTYKK